MRKHNLTGALATAALVSLCSLSGVAEAAPSLRVQVTQKGDFVLLGNTLGQDCGPSGDFPGNPVVGTVGPCPVNNSNYSPDVFWQADSPVAGQATASTAVTAATARSTAVLILPPGAAITNAYLYWGARPSVAMGDTGVVLDRPGVGGFTSNVTGTAITTNGNVEPTAPAPGTLAYQGFADVTAIVKQNGAGAYRVSGVDSMDLTKVNLANLGVGWWMVVLYNDPTAPLTQVTLFDGLDYVSTSTGTFTAPLSGFLVPSAGYTARLGVVAYGGDVGLVGDQVLWNGTALFDAQNPVNDFFNGTRSILGSPVSNVGDLPQLTGTPGSMSEFDLDVLDITSNVTPGETSANVSTTSSGDSYFLGGFITSITTFAPDFTGSTKSVADLTSGDLTDVHTGDVLQYTIVVTNTGTDTSVNTVLSDALPAGVTYLPGSLQITAGANAGAMTDASDGDQGEFLSGTDTVAFQLGTGANGTMGGQIPVGGSTTVTFQVTINANATGTIANQGIITGAGLLGATATSFPTNGNGPPPDSTTTVTIAPNGHCDVDSECPGQWCDEAVHTCTPKVANGGHVPTDPPHTNPTLIGTCTAAAGTLTCVSGLCASTGPNTGLCVACNSNAQCNSGAPVCSATTNTCVGCAQDSDCSGEWCDVSTATCTPKVPNGGHVPTDPGHTTPTLNGTCTPAAATLTCVSGLCASSGPDAGLCVACTSKAQCSGSTPVCSATTNTCVGCTQDSDCPGAWCDESTTTCTPKVANGGMVPTDPAHTSPTLDGACTPAAGSLTCQSGVCASSGPNTGLCVACVGDAQCPPGAPACSATNTCVGCTQDSDCPGEWCDESTATCSPKVANGGLVPTDPDHTNPTLDGGCTPAAGTLTCQSGICAATGPNAGHCVACATSATCPENVPVCSPTTNTCVGCTQDSNCPGEWCDESTTTCTPKVPNGGKVPTDPPHTGPTLNGACTPAAGTLTCQSGICAATGPNTGLCVACATSATCSGGTPVCSPTTNTCVGCATDSDCPGEWCDESTTTCTPKVPNGGMVPTDPAHTSPTLNGACTAPAGALTCQSGVCASTGPNAGLCVACATSAQCTGSTPVCSATTNTCIGCATDADCPGQWCDETTSTCSPKVPDGGMVPTDPNHTSPTLNGTCSPAAGTLTCQSGICASTGANAGLCVACTTNAQCPAGAPTCSPTTNTCVGCAQDSDCPGQWCDESTTTCTPKVPNGGMVPTDPDHTGPTLDGSCTPDAATLTCVSGLCASSGPNAGLCVACLMDSQCPGSTPVCSATTNTCVGCTQDSDCLGQWCDESTTTCTPKVPNGGMVPTDPDHSGPTLNGTCSVAAGTLTCVSGICASTGANAGLCVACTTNDQCPAGSPTCNTTNNTCVGCTQDSDCPGQWCDESTSTCTALVPNGGMVPTDPAHTGPTLDGSCTPAAATLTCLSGICASSGANAGLCVACLMDSQCPVGAPTCDTTTNTCSGCRHDSDCPNEWCDETTSICTPKIANGGMVPTDPAHMNPTLDGTCSTLAGTVTCASGVCATTGANMDLCVACIANAQCAAPTPVCDTTTNTCVACAVDADCGGVMSGEVCNAATSMCEPGCRGMGGNGCPTGDLCTSMDTTIGMCVKAMCLEDPDCGGPMSGEVCNTTTDMCEPGCRGMGGNGCPTGDVCTSSNNSIGMCVQCTTDSDCGGPMSGQVCDASTNMCEPGCRGMGGNGCPSGQICSSSDATVGTCSNGGTGGSTSSSSSSSSGAPPDGVIASGNGILCAARPGNGDGEGGAALWLLGGLAGLAMRRRRRR